MRKIRIAKIFKDDATGDVVLTKHPGTTVWKDFFNLMATINVPEDFMQERPMNKIPPEKTHDHPNNNPRPTDTRRP